MKARITKEVKKLPPSAFIAATLLSSAFVPTPAAFIPASTSFIPTPAFVPTPAVFVPAPATLQLQTPLIEASRSC